MALEEILDRMAKDTENEEQALIKQSEDEAKKIIEEAKKRAISIRTSYELKAKEDADTGKRQRTSSATLEGRSYLEQEREKIENDYLETLRSKILELRETEEYLAFLQRVIDNAKKALGQDSIVYLEKKDAERMKDKGISSIKPADTIGPLGGAIVTSSDGKMIIDLTFSEIVRNQGDGLRKIVRDYINR